jgi:hypothetical protein
MRPQQWFVVGLAIAIMAVIGVALHNRWQRERERTERHREGIQQLREKYPFESLEARLPPPGRGGVLSLESAMKLLQFEQSITQEMASLGRESILQKLHEGSVEEFVKREGFGAVRMLGTYNSSVLAGGHAKEDGRWVGRNKTSVPQPGSDFSALGKDEPSGESTALATFHFHSVLHFANPAGFGFVKDRRHVAGFQPHQFNEVVEQRPWKLLRLELVGLLREDLPRVYISDHLPRMQEIGELPTRPLDPFESAGLEKLHAGDELFVRETAGGARMVGAIRSAQQCVQCHGGERGDLLGAFSYRVARTP